MSAPAMRRRLARLEKLRNRNPVYSEARASDHVLDAAPYFRQLGLGYIADYLERVRRQLGIPDDQRYGVTQ